MAEELHLNLDANEAAALYLLLETAIDTLEYKKQTLLEISILPEGERPDELKDIEKINGVISLNNELTQTAKDLSKEVGNIIVELEKPEPQILPKPNWGR
jgi:hypothetical protein